MFFRTNVHMLPCIFPFCAIFRTNHAFRGTSLEILCELSYKFSKLCRLRGHFVCFFVQILCQLIFTLGQIRIST